MGPDDRPGAQSDFYRASSDILSGHCPGVDRAELQPARRRAARCARPAPESLIGRPPPMSATPAHPNGDRLLEIQDLRTYFHTRDGVVKAVDGVSFNVDRGEIVGP